MGMFDYYYPDPPLTCPVCGKELTGWQGKDGPCILSHWKQGSEFPVATNLAEDDLPDGDVARYLKSIPCLPETFTISSYECDCNREVNAFGYCTDGVWSSTSLETHENAIRMHCETERQFKERVIELAKWVSGSTT